MNKRRNKERNGLNRRDEGRDTKERKGRGEKGRETRKEDKFNPQLRDGVVQVNEGMTTVCTYVLAVSKSMASLPTSFKSSPTLLLGSGEKRERRREVGRVRMRVR